jgi:hypothetical protein
MTLARLKSWVSLEALNAADLNAEFNNILNNSLSLISPLTGNLNVDGNNLTNVNQLDIESHMIFEVTSAPSTSASQGAMFTRDVNSVAELVYREESNGEMTQISNSADLILFHEVFG